MSVKYSKRRIVGQSATKSLKYMQPLAPGTELHIQDVITDTYIATRNGKEEEVMNDTLLCVDGNGVAIKVPVREYNKMTLEGDTYNSESDSDDITLPNMITIKSSSDRTYTPQGSDEEQTLFPTFAYKHAQAFIDSKGEMTWDALLEGGVKDDNKFAAVQNYVGTVN